MGIARRLGALSPAFQTRLVGRRAQVGPLQRPSLIFVTALRAAFRTSTGSSRSASRNSTRNGESIGPSPGLPRGGGNAEKCDGVRPRSLHATAPRNSHCRPSGVASTSEPLRERDGSLRSLCGPQLLDLCALRGREWSDGAHVAPLLPYLIAGGTRPRVVSGVNETYYPQKGGSPHEPCLYPGAVPSPVPPRAAAAHVELSLRDSTAPSHPASFSTAAQLWGSSRAPVGHCTRCTR
jgi:hypothetical protein